MDLYKLCRIINASNYRGYLPIETLSPGDPFQIVPPFLKLVRFCVSQAFIERVKCRCFVYQQAGNRIIKKVYVRDFVSAFSIAVLFACPAPIVIPVA